MDWQTVYTPAQLAGIVRDSYKINKNKIGSLLVSGGVISLRQLDEALEIQQKQPMRLGLILVKCQWATDRDIRRVLAIKFGIPRVRFQALPISQETLAMLPAELAHRFQMMPLTVVANRLIVALEQPFNNEGLHMVRCLSRFRIERVMSPAVDIVLALDRYYSSRAEVEALHETGSQLHKRQGHDVAARQIEAQATSRPVVRLLNSLLLQGLVRRASDINLRPTEDSLQVYYRVDGHMQLARKLDRALHSPLVNRAKILGCMDISERRLPQDGHARINKQNRNIDLRLSTIPTTHGESVVIRVLDQKQGIRDLAALGLGKQERRLVGDMVRKPSGLILVVGPTGAGKTTTLYALLHEIKQQHRHILSVEDPVEYSLEGIEQVQVNARKGLTFSSVLRHFLRHDPDVIMVGEIRDQETAILANRAALTGHLVLSTLHTHSALGSINRLFNMGIEPYLLSDTLTGVIAQRLVRIICRRCRIVDTKSAAVRMQLGLTVAEPVWRGRGCPSCHHSGFSGRTLVTEVLSVCPSVAGMIASAAQYDKLTVKQPQQGMRLMQDQAIDLIRQGLTSVDEVLALGLEARDQVMA